VLIPEELKHMFLPIDTIWQQVFSMNAAGPK
jgi:hypothetical protein